MIRPAISALLLATALFAEPNFTGAWRMDPQRSNFGEMPLPSKLVSRIEHKGASIRVVTDQSGGGAPGRADYKYTTDGKESINKIKSNELKTVGRWQGSSLMLTHTLNFQGSETLTMEDEWRLDEGGALVQIRKMKTPQGVLQTTTVLLKQ